MSSSQKHRSATVSRSVSAAKPPDTRKSQHKRARFDAGGRRNTSKSGLKDAPHIDAPKKSANKVKIRDTPGEATVDIRLAKGKAKQVQQDGHTATASQLPSLPTTFKIIAGSYEKILYGLEGVFPVTEDGALSPSVPALTPIFIFPAHVGCVKAVAASPGGGKWLASGSTDEIVKVWDLRRRKEVGGLIQHVGSITHLEFPSRTHLLSASEDGTLCLFHTRDWAVLRSLKGHKGRINCVAVHPSGKAALSVGKDRTLRMWDFMRGRGSASTKLGKEGELVRWSTAGTMLAVQAQSTIDLYSTDMNLLHSINHLSRIQDIKFSTRSGGEGQVLLVGAEDKKVSVYEMEEGETQFTVIAEFIGHSNRVKALDTLAIAYPSNSAKPSISTILLSTASSDGKIHVYNLAALPALGQALTAPEQIEPLVAYDTKGTRLTCITMADGEMVAVPQAARKRKQPGDDEDDSDEDESEEGSEEGTEKDEEEGDSEGDAELEEVEDADESEDEDDE